VGLRSGAVAVLLVIAGLLRQIPPLQAILEAGTIAVPGPILGAIFFAPVLVLGIVKAAAFLRSEPRSEKQGTNQDQPVSRDQPVRFGLLGSIRTRLD
jgi:hypothetical protein